MLKHNSTIELTLGSTLQLHLVVVGVLELEDVLVPALRVPVDHEEVVGDLGVEVRDVLPLARLRIPAASHQAQVPEPGMIL